LSALLHNQNQKSKLQMATDYGDVPREHSALLHSAGVLDLSFRSRLCLVGSDRVRFLHGQVTNDIKGLREGAGCYAALVTPKGRMQSDLNVYNLGQELLLDFEPDLSVSVSQRLEKYIVADDVQVVDVAPLYGLWSIQGPCADRVVKAVALVPEVPLLPGCIARINHANYGEVYLANHPRLGINGFDLFLPKASLDAVAARMVAEAEGVGGCMCGWNAFEMARVEAGIPRFGADMDETNFPQECGIEARAVSYTKGCYIGQEVLNRLHTLGHVNRELRALRFVGPVANLPARGDKLFRGGQEVGYITSAVASVTLKTSVALGYVRKEVNQVGTELVARCASGEYMARIVEPPHKI
jgi:folate-binding protein YgfZ